MRVSSWIKHLKNRGGSKFIKQMYRMWKFHRTPFQEILYNIIDTLDPYDAKFTFPTIASVTPYQPDNIKLILDEGHEIANHGYKHVKYPFLSDSQQEKEFELSMKIFEEFDIPIHGFRAPYNNYNEFTIELVEKYGFEWDGGVGYKPEFRFTNEMFYYTLDSGEKTSFVSIPCHRYADDLLIDGYHMRPQEISKLLRAVIHQASRTGGVIMFDLHPIRMGQEKYVKVLDEITKYAYQLNAWIPRVVEAVRYWEKFGSWKGDADFCLLLTGDIDNFVFFDYVRRLL